MKTTMLDLVQTVNRFSTNDAETVATVAYLINSGKVRLCGNYAGAIIDLSLASYDASTWTAAIRIGRKTLRIAAH